jgi:hypothetical protein
VPDDPGAAPAAPADGGGGGPATPTDATDPATTAAPDPTADSAAPPPSTEVATAPTAVPSSSSGTAPPIYENTAEVGGLARSLLQPQPRASVVLEIDVVAGSRVPAAANVANLVDVLKRETGKPVAVDQRSVTATVPAQQVWTITDVARAEYQARAHRPIDGGSVSVMVLYLPGRYVSDTVLGFAFRGGSVAIFPDRLDASGNALVTPQQIEKSNLVHEAGHLLGLVNIDSRVYTSPRPHEDTTHRGHSKNTRSVMFWAIESTSVTTILSGGPPDSFDGDDEADLADIRSGSS